MARGSFWRRITSTIKAVGRAIRHPETYAPPPLPTVPPPEPPAPAPRPRPAPRPPTRDVVRPPVVRARYIPRDELPDEWGRNKAALWQDATKAHNNIGYDPDAQALYDAALYSFDEDPDNRAAILQNLKDYIADTYNVDWDKVFDWEDYRANYDTAGGRGTFAHGGVLHT